MSSKKDWKFLPVGDPYRVILHAEWCQRRRKKRSMPYNGERNPDKAYQKALVASGRSTAGNVMTLVQPPNYICATCGAEGCKLFCNTKTKTTVCVECIGLHLRITKGGGKGEIFLFPPAIPRGDGSKAYLRWDQLPETMPDWWQKCLDTMPRLRHLRS